MTVTSTASSFANSVSTNQEERRRDLRKSYDFVICGSGSSGSVVARRLAENLDVHVLLLEAGGPDDHDAIADPLRWPENLGSERDWGFEALPNPALNGRRLPLGMGRVLGGGSSINVMLWSRGHRNDWEYFADQSGDAAWGYDSVLAIYKRIEDWHGIPDAHRRGTGGLVYVQPLPDPSPLTLATLDAAAAGGLPTYPDQNGAMMDGEGGCSLPNVRIRNGKRESIFRTYTYPVMDQPNLTVLTDATVTRVLLDGRRATGVEFVRDGRTQRVDASGEVILSLGAMHTPKVLMQSGIGDAGHLGEVGIPVVQHLPGVGENLQDHLYVASCAWEYVSPVPPRNNAIGATMFWKSRAELDAPDLQILQVEIAGTTPETAHYAPPAGSWSLLPGLVRPHSRGRLRLTRPTPDAPLAIDARTLTSAEDVEALMRCTELCREVGNGDALRGFAKREVMPGRLSRGALESFVRDGASTYWHQTCTAKMGRDEMSVVDARLKVYGIDGLRIADGSIMPRVTTGNTMAPCVIIGERASDLIRSQHGL